MTSLITALAAAAVLAVLIAGVAYHLLPEKVFLRQQSLVRKHRRRSEQMQISDICEVKYHYHAVVGYVAVWEFLDRNGNALVVDAEARGADDVLRRLEKLLPGFSMADFARKFEAGDVEDSLDVWQRRQ